MHGQLLFCAQFNTSNHFVLEYFSTQILRGSGVTVLRLTTKQRFISFAQPDYKLYKTLSELAEKKSGNTRLVLHYQAVSNQSSYILLFKFTIAFVRLLQLQEVFRAKSTSMTCTNTKVASVYKQLEASRILITVQVISIPQCIFNTHGKLFCETVQELQGHQS